MNVEPKAFQVVIDGKNVAATAGTTVLEAAQSAGIPIPSLCQHPCVSPASMCKICAVEVEGTDGLHCSCFPVADGMVIGTETACMREYRQNVLQGIVKERTSRDCLACSDNMRCELQRVVSRFCLD